MGGHFNVGRQAAVNAKADAGLAFARQRLDVDVGSLLVVGIDDDLVDELDQFVVCRGGHQRVDRTRVVIGGHHLCQHLVDRAAIQGRGIELIQRLGKLGVGRHAVGKAGLAWEHLSEHTGTARRLGIQAQHNQAFRRLLQRNPAVGFDEVALQFAVQRLDPDATALGGFIGHAKKTRQRQADLRRGDALLINQQLLYRFATGPCLLLARHQLPGGQLAGADQAIVAARLAAPVFSGLVDSLANGGRQGLAELRSPFELECAKRQVIAGIDHLQHAEKRITMADGQHHDLLGPVA